MYVAIHTPNIISQIITELYASKSYTFHDARLVDRAWYHVFVITMRKLNLNPEHVTLRAFLYAMKNPAGSNLFSRKQPSIRNMLTAVSKHAAKLGVMALCTGPDAVHYAIRYNRTEWLDVYFRLGVMCVEAIETAAIYGTAETFDLVVNEFGSWDDIEVYRCIMKHTRVDLMIHALNTRTEINIEDFYDCLDEIDFTSTDPDYVERVMQFTKHEEFAWLLLANNISKHEFQGNLIVDAMLQKFTRIEISDIRQITPLTLQNLNFASQIIHIPTDSDAYRNLSIYRKSELKI